MSCTIFYKGTLKKTKNPNDVFNIAIKIAKNANWSYKTKENVLLINFNDGKSETLVFDFVNHAMSGWCKHSLENPESYYIVLDLFYAIMDLFCEYEVSDDFGAWDEYLANKNPCEIHLRDLTVDELSKIERIFLIKDEKMPAWSKNDLLLRVIANDIKKNDNDTITYQYLIDNINPKVSFAGYLPELAIYAILETWLYETMTYKNEGRVSDLDLKKIYSSIGAFTFGIAETLFETWGGSHGAKQAQIIKFYKEEFLKAYDTEKWDIKQEAILMYRYIVSILDYLGFKFVGKATI